MLEPRARARAHTRANRAAPVAGARFRDRRFSRARAFCAYERGMRFEVNLTRALVVLKTRALTQPHRLSIDKRVRARLLSAANAGCKRARAQLDVTSRDQGVSAARSSQHPQLRKAAMVAVKAELNRSRPFLHLDRSSLLATISILAPSNNCRKSSR